MIAERPGALPDEQLIPALLLQAAYRMEDSAPALVRAWPPDRIEQTERIQLLASVSGDLAGLANAASVLHRGICVYATGRS